MVNLNQYQKIVERIFLAKHRNSIREIEFDRAEIETAAAELEIKLPRDLKDLTSAFRYRSALPTTVSVKAPAGREWTIRNLGKSRYCFVAERVSEIVPNENLSQEYIPDATPGIIAMYLKHSMTSNQALLPRMRYNRLMDLFTGLTCYCLQTRVRSRLRGLGHVETDEIYIGIDRRGAHYVLPVQAKGIGEALSCAQVEQDFGMAETKFPGLICRPIAAQFMSGDLIALFEFEQTDSGIKILAEKHYRLVPPDEISAMELESYRNRNLT